MSEGRDALRPRRGRPNSAAGGEPIETDDANDATGPLCCIRIDSFLATVQGDTVERAEDGGYEKTDR